MVKSVKEAKDKAKPAAAKKAKPAVAVKKAVKKPAAEKPTTVKPAAKKATVRKVTKKAAVAVAPAAVHAPAAHAPVPHAPVAHTPAAAPVAPVVHKPAAPVAPVVHKPAAPVAPVVHKPAAPVAPVVHKPAAPVAPVVHKPAAPIAPVQKPAAPVAPAQKTHVPSSTPVHKPAVPVPPPAPAAYVAAVKEVELTYPISLKDLSIKLQEKPSVLIKLLMDMRVMVSINQMLDEKIVAPLCQKMGVTITQAATQEEAALQSHQEEDQPADLVARSPIVTFMGHVDHGKTSLLDAIRKTKVVGSEHGGITQHIGAYSVKLPHGRITFLDTPGHEAFTAMRARGARITDIVVLVVAADDGVMPQTREAIDHAKAAGVSIIVALNKIDKPGANPDMVKKQLSTLGLASEDWGGKTITVPVSAKTGAGIDQLLEMILLEAEMLELKANAGRPGKGVVVESKLSKGRGPVATFLVQNGTLRINDSIIVGPYYGKIRAMLDAFGHPVREAGPAVPVEVLGLEGVPEAGEQFFALEERTAKEIAQRRQETERQQQMKAVKRISLEDLHNQIKEGKLKELKLIIKSDVQGSLEAIKDTLAKLNISEVGIVFIHEGVGSINSSDVILAVASDALILGFNVTPDDPAKALIDKEGVDVRVYNIIYELANDVKAAIVGMLEPKIKKSFLGRAEVRKVFRLTKAGTVAGCFVTKGKITRSAPVSLVRNGEHKFEGAIKALKRFKDDVREVTEGFECGISLQGFDALQEGDVIEAFEIQKIAQTL